MKPRTRRYAGKSFTQIGRGTEAHVWEVSRKTRKNIVIRTVHSPARERRASIRKQLQKRYIATRIANLLFPENSAKVLEFNPAKLRLSFHKAEPDKLLDEYQQTEIELMRLERKFHAKKITDKETQSYNRIRSEHQRLEAALQDRKKQKHVKGQLKMFDNAGLVVDPGAPNISVHHPENPVFYEIIGINKARLERFLDKNKRISTRKRSAILRLMAQYKDKEK
jgi:hypothetical protein